jgi:hypothetical protein
MNEDLNKLLNTWTPGTCTGADIRAGVWQRIERIAPTLGQVVINYLFAQLMRPALVTGLVAVAILAGVTIGSIASESAQTRAYLNSVTAYRMHQ